MCITKGVGMNILNSNGLTMHVVPLVVYAIIKIHIRVSVCEKNVSIRERIRKGGSFTVLL